MRTPTMLWIALSIPIYLFAQESRGITLYKEGKYAEAATALKTEVEREPANGTKLAYLGLARLRSNDVAGARESLTKALSINEKNAEAHFGMGLLQMKAEKVDEAITELERAVTIAPGHAYAHYYLGMAYHKRGQKDSTIKHLRRFLELAPNAPEAPTVRSFLERI